LCEKVKEMAAPANQGYSITTSWRKSVINQLHARNQREVSPFHDLVTSHLKILERTNLLKAENAQLKYVTEKLKEDLRNVRSGAGGSGDGAAAAAASVAVASGGDASTQAAISMLEKKLLARQEELTELHRRKGENAQQIIEQTNQLRAAQLALEENAGKLKKAESELQAAQGLVSQLTNQIQELQFTNQLLKDEHQASLLAWNSKEKELLEVQKENTNLVKQIMEFKDRDVALMNQENDTFLKLQRERIKQQLAEAAAEPKPVQTAANIKSRMTKVGQDTMDSAICAFVRIPTRAYLKFEAHEGEINAIKWSPHGLNVATGGSDRKIKLWDVAKGQNTLCATLRGSNGSIMSIDYDSAGTLLLAASYGDFACRVWSTDDLKLRHTFTGHNKEVLSAKFMEDSKKFVSASHDRTLRIWDLRSKACISTKFAGSMCNDVVCVDTSIISGHYDCTLKFWDTRSGNTPTNEIKLGGKIASLDVSRNGHYVLACSRDNLITLMDVRTYGQLATFSADGFQVGCDWTRAAFSPDSEHICVGSASGAVYIWNVATPSKLEKSLHMPGGHEATVVSVAWQPAGNGLTTCDKNKNVVVWADI